MRFRFQKNGAQAAPGPLGPGDEQTGPTNATSHQRLCAPVSQKRQKRSFTVGRNPTFSVRSKVRFPVGSLRRFLDAARKRYTVAAAHAPRMGMVSSALLGVSLIQHLRPRLIAMKGICAGVRGKVALGDVLLADPSWDFQSGKRVRDGDASSLSGRAHQLAAPDRVRKLLQELQRERTGVQALCDAFGSARPNDAGIKVGPVACGSAVLADGLLIGEIRSRQQDDMIGVEMEIYGVYAAARAAADHSFPIGS